MSRETDSAYLRQLQVTLRHLIPVAVLREGHRVIATLPPKARMARLFSGFDTAKEGLKGQIHALGHILQDLGMRGF